MQYGDSWLAVRFNLQALQVTTETLFIGYFESLDLQFIFENLVNKTELKKRTSQQVSVLFMFGMEPCVKIDAFYLLKWLIASNGVTLINWVKVVVGP